MAGSSGSWYIGVGFNPTLVEEWWGQLFVCCSAFTCVESEIVEWASDPKSLGSRAWSHFVHSLMLCEPLHTMSHTHVHTHRHPVWQGQAPSVPERCSCLHRTLHQRDTDGDQGKRIASQVSGREISWLYLCVYIQCGSLCSVHYSALIIFNSRCVPIQKVQCSRN